MTCKSDLTRTWLRLTRRASEKKNRCNFGGEDEIIDHGRSCTLECKRGYRLAVVMPQFASRHRKTEGGDSLVVYISTTIAGRSLAGHKGEGEGYTPPDHDGELMIEVIAEPTSTLTCGNGRWRSDDRGRPFCAVVCLNPAPPDHGYVICYKQKVSLLLLSLLWWWWWWWWWHLQVF